MRPFGELVSAAEAEARLAKAAPLVAREEDLPLAQALGRVAAAVVEAGVAVPPFPRATMDGYAVRAAEGAMPRRLAGDVFAGRPAARALGAAEAMRIATGAPVPEGADSVVRVEDAEEEGPVLQVRTLPRPGRFIDAAGSDVALGARVAEPGTLLTPARLGLLASVGIERVRVRARPRAALFSSGDELLKPGDKPAPGRVYDSNTTSLRALLEEAGAAVEAMPALPDEVDALRQALRKAAATHDLVLFSGGASVGAKDLVVDALRAEGDVLFHGVRVKPGKPLLAGRVGGALVVGLPGNPTSALSNAALFVAPAVRRMAGLPPLPPRTLAAPLAEEVKGERDRFLFLPVRVADERVFSTFKGSGALTSMAESDGWIGVPEGARLEAGALVLVHLW